MTFCAFDFNSFDCGHNDVNGGFRVVPEVKTFLFMLETIRLVFINVEKKWRKVKHSSKTLHFFYEI